MKKLYNSKGPKRIHPSPTLSSSSSSSYSNLSCLPTALLTLASTLSAQEQEVLAYLLNPEKQKKAKNKQKNHEPQLGCSCFACYTSYWARWDASPNRHVIHLIIDVFEEKLELKEKIKKGKKKRGLKNKVDEAFVGEFNELSLEKVDEGCVVNNNDDFEVDNIEVIKEEVEEGEEEGEEEEEEEKSSVKRFISWVLGN